MAICASNLGVSLGGCLRPERVCRSRREATGTSAVRTKVRNPAFFHPVQQVDPNAGIFRRVQLEPGEIRSDMRCQILGHLACDCRQRIGNTRRAGGAGQMSFGIRPDQPGHPNRRDPNG